MSDARHFRTDQAINPYYSDSPLNPEKAQEEHQAIQYAFRQAGISVIPVVSPETSQDGVYTANWALVRGSTAILARLPDVRKSEESYARQLLEAHGLTVVSVPDGLHFSGQGDALACGNYLFCGKGYRSDEAAQKFAADTLGYTRIQLQALPQRDSFGKPLINPVSGWADSFFYDIDLAISIIRAPEIDSASQAVTPGIVAYCPDALTKESAEKIEALPDIDTIHVSLYEAQQKFACNLVSTGETVIMGDGALELKGNLEAHGLTVVTPHIEELAKGGGYVRCTSLTLA